MVVDAVHVNWYIYIYIGVDAEKVYISLDAVLVYIGIDALQVYIILCCVYGCRFCADIYDRRCRAGVHERVYIVDTMQAFIGLDAVNVL